MNKGEFLGKMLVLATQLHAGQFDKGGNPYILHPLKVMHYLRSEDEELQCIALGHDLIEDTDLTYDRLRDEGFSKRVIEGIRCLTKQVGETYDEYKARVFSNEDAMRVKMADLRRIAASEPVSLAERIEVQKFYLEIERTLESRGDMFKASRVDHPN